MRGRRWRVWSVRSGLLRPEGERVAMRSMCESDELLSLRLRVFVFCVFVYLSPYQPFKPEGAGLRDAQAPRTPHTRFLCVCSVHTAHGYASRVSLDFVSYIIERLVEVNERTQLTLRPSMSFA